MRPVRPFPIRTRSPWPRKLLRPRHRRALPPPWESCKVTAKAWVKGIMSVGNCRMWWLPVMVTNMRHNRILITCNDAVALPLTQLASQSDNTTTANPGSVTKSDSSTTANPVVLTFDPSLSLSLSLSRFLAPLTHQHTQSHFT